MTAVSVFRYRRPDVNRHGGITKCLDCDRLPNGCTRERCRQHAAKSGHRVQYVVEDVTVYGPPATDVSLDRVTEAGREQTS